MSNNKICLSCYVHFSYAEYSTSATITIKDKGPQRSSTRLTDASLKQYYSTQNHGYDKLSFITNFIHKVYNKHPSGRSLVYSYRLLYRPTARADHPHGFVVQSKGSRPPVSSWSAHLPQWMPPTTPWLTCLIRVG